MIRPFPFSSLWFRVALPVATVTVAAVLRSWFMEDLGGRFPFVTFFYAMMLSAFIGGPVLRTLGHVPLDDLRGRAAANG